MCCRWLGCLVGPDIAIGPHGCAAVEVDQQVSAASCGARAGVIDLFFTILLPLFLILSGTGFIFGGAKPVPVNVSRLRNPRRDWALVGAAGPLSNLAIAVLLAVLLSLLSHGGLAPSSPLTKVLAVGIFVNMLLAVFNLLPIPPLDGSRVAQYSLSGEALRAYRQLERFGLLLIVALVFFVRPVQAFLVDAVVVCTASITGPLGV